MRILFVNSHVFYSEPLGTMQLSSICRDAGHETRLAVITRDSMKDVLEDFEPDLVGYSTMTPNEHYFVNADAAVRSYAESSNKRVCRIMGGPHPTYFPEIMDKMGLDAVVAGDGDHAIARIVERLEQGADLTGIPNVATPEQREYEKEVITDLDSLPFLDREVFYRAAPDLQKVGIRSFLTQRGCPYKCTYCFNHAFNTMFKGEGRKLIRRRSVDNVIEEVKHVARYFGPERFVRFADDVFVIRRDEWLEEFAERFPREVGLPFYCLIRATALTEDVAELLAQAGCRSASMSIEAGSPELRNVVLKRNMSDEVMYESFAIARKHGITTHANTILGLPGTTLKDDFESYRFAKSLRPTAPTFSIFCPYPRTELTRYAVEQGVLPEDFDYNVTYRNRSVLTNYTDRERDLQLRFSYLAAIFCFVPNFMEPLLKLLIRLPLTRLYGFAEASFETYLRGLRVFPGAQPKRPLQFLKSGWAAVAYIFRNSRTTVQKDRAVEQA